MERFRGSVEGAGLDFHTLPGDPTDVFADVRLDVAPARPVHHIHVVRRAVDALVSRVDAAPLVRDWADADCLIFGTTTTFAHFIAPRIGAASLMVGMTPAVATGSFAHPLLAPRLGLGRRGNLLTWLLGERLARQTFKEPLKPGVRRRWQLPGFPLGTARGDSSWPPFPVMHALSRHVIERPHDWPPHVTVTGWLLPAESSEPLAADIERFLEDDPVPIYVGFGSMPLDDPEHVGGVLVRALARTRQRAIVCGAPLAQVPAVKEADAVLTTEEVPHERLLRRVSAVVHHGGSGTTGAGLRAGRPTLAIPFAADQFFWAERIKRLGVGPPPIPFGRLSEDRLVAALQALGSGRYDAVARRLGEQIGGEDGVSATADQIELTLAARHID
jgi:UDP:flavonoid glycosyltransferase YjiC (YdhE family)